MSLQNQFTPNCPACGQPCQLMEGKLVEPMNKLVAKRHFYVCMTHDMRAICYPDTLRPMGEPGNVHLRRDREFIRRQLEKAADRKADRDRIERREAAKDAWKWASDKIGRDVRFPEEISFEDAEILVPLVRRF